MSRIDWQGLGFLVIGTAALANILVAVEMIVSSDIGGPAVSVAAVATAAACVLVAGIAWGTWLRDLWKR